jgi:hypothetical protein
MADGTGPMELFPENNYLRIRHAVLVLAHVRGVLLLKAELAPATFATGLGFTVAKVIQRQPRLAAGAPLFLAVKKTIPSQFTFSYLGFVFGTPYNNYLCR